MHWETKIICVSCHSAIVSLLWWSGTTLPCCWGLPVLTSCCYSSMPHRVSFSISIISSMYFFWTHLYSSQQKLIKSDSFQVFICPLMAWNSTILEGLSFIGISRWIVVLSWFLIHSRTEERKCAHTPVLAEGKVPEGGGRSKLEKLKCDDSRAIEKMLKDLEIGPSFCFRWMLMRSPRSLTCQRQK